MRSSSVCSVIVEQTNDGGWEGRFPSVSDVLSVLPWQLGCVAHVFRLISYYSHLA